MRKIVLLLTLSLIIGVLYAQKVRIGLITSPGIAWAKAHSNAVSSGKVRFAIDYGLSVDIRLGQHDNYYLSTGVNVLLTGGTAIYEQGGAFNSRFPNSEIEATFRKQYLRLPIAFKLKTNQIGYITYFASFGAVPGFRIQARMDAERNGNELYDNENLLRGNVTVFKSKLFQIGLEVSGGVEYALNDRTALVIALVYHNAFVDAVKDPDKEKLLFNHVALRTGIIF